mmetsp:Transcript_26538/g.44428  ORF Transcript_26538/g.44428 Transcript_26538/m.44428 type:complete len:217 (+) Transcript_26538:298-948(+)
MRWTSETYNAWYFSTSSGVGSRMCGSPSGRPMAETIFFSNGTTVPHTPQNQVMVTPIARDIARRTGDLATFNTCVLPNKYTGMTSTPLCRATLMNPFRFFTKRRSSFSSHRNSSEIPPGYSTTLRLARVFFRVLGEASHVPNIPTACFTSGNFITTLATVVGQSAGSQKRFPHSTPAQAPPKVNTPCGCAVKMTRFVANSSLISASLVSEISVKSK